MFSSIGQSKDKSLTLELRSIFVCSINFPTFIKFIYFGWILNNIDPSVIFLWRKNTHGQYHCMLHTFSALELKLKLCLTSDIFMQDETAKHIHWKVKKLRYFRSKITSKTFCSKFYKCMRPPHCVTNPLIINCHNFPQTSSNLLLLMGPVFISLYCEDDMAFDE